MRTKAESYVGITENPPGSNRVIISTWADQVWWLGFSRQGSQWCGCYVDLVLGKKMMPGSVFSVAFGMGQFKDADRWSTTPQPGYVCFMSFTPDRFPGHVGITIDVINDYTVDNIEGNTQAGYSGAQDNGGGVYHRTRSGSEILGWGIVDYEPEESGAMLPYLMIKSANYRNIYGFFETGVLRPLSGIVEFSRLQQLGVPYNATADDEEIKKAHQLSNDPDPLSPV